MTNGRPTIVYQIPTLSPITHTETTIQPETKLPSQKITIQPELKKNFPSTKPSPASISVSTSTTISPPTTTTTTTKSYTSTDSSTTSSLQNTKRNKPPLLNTSSTSESLPTISQPLSMTEQPFIPLQPSTKRPFLPYTNSPMTWLKGSFFFNGKPKDLFIFKSKPHLKTHFEHLHKTYPKPGVYLR